MELELEITEVDRVAGPTPGRVCSTRHRRWRLGGWTAAAVSCLLLIGLVLGACGSSSDDRPLGSLEEDLLHRRLSDAREAASLNDAKAVVQSLGAFRRDVRHLRQEGALSTQEARGLLVGATQAQARAVIELGPPPQPQSTRPPAAGGGEDGGDGGDD